MEDVNVHFWLRVDLWKSEVHLGPHWDVRKSSLRISCMMLDGIIFSYEGKEDCFRNDISLFSTKQERLASGN